MKKFKFNLNRVLDIKILKEEQSQNRFVQEQLLTKEIESLLVAMKTEQKKLYHYIREQKDLSVEESIQARNFLYQQRKKINKQKGELDNQEKKLKKFHQDYIKKRQERRVLEKLKEKKQQDYCQEVLLKEQKVLDEIALRVKRIEGS